MRRRSSISIAITAMIFALVMVSAAPAGGADITGLYMATTSYDQDPAQGSTFQVSFSVNVPSDVTIPVGSEFYYSAFYFDDEGDIYYPSEGYWDVSGGNAIYSSSQTDYTLNVQMKSDATVGQDFYLGIYWKIPLTGSYQKSGDNVTFTIGDNTYTLTIVDTDVYDDYTKYTVYSGAFSDVYVRTDKTGILYVRTLESGLTVTEKAGAKFSIPTWLLIALGVVVPIVIVAVAAVKLKGRGPGEFAEAPPEKPPEEFPEPPSSPETPPHPEPESPPSPESTPP